MPRIARVPVPVSIAKTKRFTPNEYLAGSLLLLAANGFEGLDVKTKTEINQILLKNGMLSNKDKFNTWEYKRWLKSEMLRLSKMLGTKEA
jgi:hypothetical protein